MMNLALKMMNFVLKLPQVKQLQAELAHAVAVRGASERCFASVILCSFLTDPYGYRSRSS